MIDAQTRAHPLQAPSSLRKNDSRLVELASTRRFVRAHAAYRGKRIFRRCLIRAPRVGFRMRARAARAALRLCLMPARAGIANARDRRN